MIKILVIITGVLMFSCSKSSSSDIEENIKSGTIQNKISNQKTTLIALFDYNKAQIKGDYLVVTYSVETYSNNTFLKGSMDCSEKSINKMSCNAVAELNHLNPGIYRLLVRGGDGLLGSDLFEIQPGLIPVVITIDNESTGFYLISQITQQTGLREDEIYVRVKHILNSDDNGDYDLELTLCDLFVYYGGHTNYKNAINLMSLAIKDNKPLPKRNKSYGISQTLQPLN